MRISLLLIILCWPFLTFADLKECNRSLDIDTPYGNLSEGISYRGFLGNSPTATPEAQLDAMKYLIMRWGLKIYAVNSEIDAQSHHDLKLNRDIPVEERKSEHYISPPDAPLYVITNKNPNLYLDFLQDKNDIDVNQYFHNLANVSEVFFFKLNGEKVKLSKEEIERLKNVIYHKNDDSDHFFYVPGWFAPTYVGVESVTRFMTSSSSPNKTSSQYKELSKEMRQFVKNGGRITFNKALDDLLIMAGTQARIGRTNKVSKKEDIEKNPRYNKANRDVYLELQKQGKAFSVEVWDGDPNDSNTRLLGGTFGKINGSMITVESLAYVEMRKVRNFNNNKEPLFIVGQGLVLTEEEAIKKGDELYLEDLNKNVNPEKIVKREAEGFYTPRPSYVWEDAHKDQSGPDGEVIFMRDENGEIEFTPRGRFADYANVALYEELRDQGLEYTNVGMVTPKSYSLFKARYVHILDALEQFQQQHDAFGDREIVFPRPDDFYRPREPGELYKPGN
ncbi:MAG: hypothetical protein KDD58_08605 [Bdellovibrionales bacterium]|nr:hypothetical protein [Bdellovibrionales bacterium]